MKNTVEKSLPSQTIKDSKFNIKSRFDKLNRAQKRLLLQEYRSIFKVNMPSAYYTIREKETLNDEELLFFADMFGCTIADLYKETPPRRPTIFEIERQADACTAA